MPGWLTQVPPVGARSVGLAAGLQATEERTGPAFDDGRNGFSAITNTTSVLGCCYPPENLAAALLASVTGRPADL